MLPDANVEAAGLGWAVRWVLASIIVVSSARYMYWVAGRWGPGLARLCAALPVLVALHAVPLLFDPFLEPISVLAAAFLSCRLSSGKVVALCMGRGALAMPLTWPQFASIMIFPVVPDASAQGRPLQQLVSRTSVDLGDSLARAPSVRQPAPPARARGSIDIGADILKHTPLQSSRPSPLMRAPSAPPKPVAIPTAPSTAPAANMLLQAAVVAAFVLYCAATPDRMLAVARHLGGLWIMWQLYGGMMVAHRIGMAPVLGGLALAPAFRNPFAATSLGDFWARRWNMTQSLVLKAWVYDPIVQGRLVSAPGDTATALPSELNAAQRRRRRQIASAATFIVSGIEHELFHYYIARSASPAWRWFLFFAVQAPLLMVEGEVKRFAKLKGLVLHAPVSSFATLMVLGACAEALFWPPICQEAILARVAASARSSMAALADLWQSAGMQSPPPPVCGLAGADGWGAVGLRLLSHPETYLPCCRGA